MKRIVLLYLMAQTICIASRAQTTHYGLASGTQGANSSYFGVSAGQLATSSSVDNSFFGAFAGIITTGTQNSGFGSKALFSNSSGIGNAATGYQSLYSNTTGSHNTANGYWTLYFNTIGSDNIAIGSYAMTYNTSGNYNTAVGKLSLYKNDFGYANSAVGYKALYSNNWGFNNSANGYESLFNNKDGNYNTANGFRALYSNVSGGANTATGDGASYLNSRGISNTSNGSHALYNNTIGNYNSAFGADAGPNAGNLENTTALGYLATTMVSNSVRIGNTSVTSIGGYASWSTLSDGRFKRNIKEDVSGLDFVNQLRPVSYEVDKTALNKFLRIPDSVAQRSEVRKAPVRQIGFVAQEVEAVVKKTGYVFTGVEAPQNENDHYSIRYAEFVVPLVKAVQELTAIINEQEKKAEEQQLEIAALKEKLGINNSVAADVLNNNKAALFQNTPNPFSSDTEIKMTLPETARQAHLILYNMEGKQLKRVQLSERGSASVKISAGEFNDGIYLYALIVDGKVVDTKRLIMMK